MIALLACALSACGISRPPLPTPLEVIASTPVDIAAPTPTVVAVSTARPILPTTVLPTSVPARTLSPYWLTQDAAVVDVQQMTWEVQLHSAGEMGDAGAPSSFTSMSFFTPQQGWALGKAWKKDVGYQGVSLGYTTDGGVSWQSRPVPDRGIACLNDVAEILFLDERVGWMRCGGILGTRDGGMTWAVLSETDPILAWGRAPTGQVWAWMRSAGDYSVVREPRPGAISDWRDLVAAWPNHDIGPRIDGAIFAPSIWDARSIAFQGPIPTDGSILSGPWWATRDGGATWRVLTRPCGERGWPYESVSPGPGSVFWAVCAGIGATAMEEKQLLFSVDDGQTWELKAGAYSPAQQPLTPPPAGITISGHMRQIQALSESAAYVLTNRLARPILTWDAGNTWNVPHLYPCVVGDDSTHGAFLDDTYGWMNGRGGLARTSDGGRTWTCLAYPTPPR